MKKRSILRADERSLRVKERLLEQGIRSVKDAARKSGIGYIHLTRMIRYGMPTSPHQKTVESLRRLNILDLLQETA